MREHKCDLCDAPPRHFISEATFDLGSDAPIVMPCTHRLCNMHFELTQPPYRKVG